MHDLTAWAARRSMNIKPRQLPSGQWVWEDVGFFPSDFGNRAPEAAQAVADHINGLRTEVTRLGEAQFRAGLRFAAAQEAVIVLAELVRLKDLKDRSSATSKAWAQARRIVDKPITEVSENGRV